MNSNPQFGSKRSTSGASGGDSAWVDPEAYDASEQEFAASLEEGGSGVVIPEESPDAESLSAESLDAESLNTESVNTEFLQEESELPVEQELTGGFSAAAEASASTLPSHAVPAAHPDAWRQEVAARVNRYRARRQPRAPRYPSLQLKFEPEEPAWSAPSFSGEAGSQLARESSPQTSFDGWPVEQAAGKAPAMPAPATSEEPSARVIPFRRSVPMPPRPLEELAEPLQLFPRILEVPESELPPPALGGILIEPAIEEPQPKRPGIEIPLQTSPISRRFLAAGVDAVIVTAAFCLFAYIFLRITAAAPPLKQAAEGAVLIFGVLWSGYQYLLLTYAGTTPGLLLTKLRLGRFDGSMVPQPLRRWRALAAILSAVSLGLGYVWCMLDEDQLCWHDRITRTHMAPVNINSCP